ncbi:MAG: hypothetical protein H0U49_09000 [Parachlamydiaceae bacterium]|nr:hypothetical protein [Parachlamydiaceae bacterium]
MNLFLIFFIGLLAQFSTIHGDQTVIDTKEIVISLEEHILPNDHPIKQKLDALFNAENVIASPVSFKKAGFYSSKERRKGLIVSGHPSFPGYLFKLYLETSSTSEVEQYTKRINGSVLIQKALDKYKYNHIMKVPKKYVYKVPESKSSLGKYPKKYILIVDDMDIFSDEENRKLYKTIITREHLEALFKILTTCLLSDSTWLPNIPFSHDGRIAFIDTEFAGNSQTIWTRLGRMSKNLSPEMRSYWATIVMNHPRSKALDGAPAAELDLSAFVEASDFEEIDVLSYEYDVLPANKD